MLNLLLFHINILRLGAVHDGTTFQGKDATSCPAGDNNIMTPNVGAFSNANAMFFFSSCSIDAFKSTLLSPDMTFVSKYYHLF